jgi:hypothetical protein
MPNPIRITRPELYKIAGEACRDTKTVEKVLAGGGNDQSRASVIEAAKRLGIDIGITVRTDEAPALTGERARFLAERSKGT